MTKYRVVTTMLLTFSQDIEAESPLEASSLGATQIHDPSQAKESKMTTEVFIVGDAK